MQHAQRAVTVFSRFGNHAKRVDVGQLFKRDMAFLHLFPDGIWVLLSSRNFDLKPRLLHFPGDRLVNLVDFDISLVADLLQTASNRLICLRLQLFKGEQLHLAHIFIHANPLCQRRVDIHRFLGDAAALFRAFDKMQRPHIVQPVGQLDQKHADIIGNRQQEFAQIFGSAFILGLGLNFRQLGYAVNQPRHFGTKAVLDIFDGCERVFHRVMQQRGDDRVLIHFEVSHQASDLYRMAEIRVPRCPLLRAMHLHREHICPVEPIFIDIRRISTHPFNQFILPHHHSKLGLLRCDATGK